MGELVDEIQRLMVEPITLLAHTAELMGPGVSDDDRWEAMVGYLNDFAIAHAQAAVALAVRIEALEAP